VAGPLLERFGAPVAGWAEGCAEAGRGVADEAPPGVVDASGV